MSIGVEIFNGSEYKEICYNISNPKHLHKDLHQETLLTILNKNVDYSMVRNFRFFFAAYAWMTFNSNKFKKNYRAQNLELIDEIYFKEIEEYDTTLDVKIDKIIYETKREKLTEREKYLDLLFQRYLECGESGYVVSKTYDIPVRTVYLGISEYRNKLKVIYENTGSSNG